MTETVTMSTLVSTITTIVTAAISWITSFVNLVTGNPLLLLFVLIGFVGLGIGLMRRLMR